MITDFKIFENTTTEYNLGDYVLMKYSNIGQSVSIINKLRYFIADNIGIIVDIRNKNRNYANSTRNNILIYVKYNNIPSDISGFFNSDDIKLFYVDDMLVFGKTLDELELKINAKKYNI